MACSGTPWPCSYHYIALCYTCGCFWDEMFEECLQTPDACVTHDNQGDCEDCGCEWTVPGINVKINIGDAWRDAEEMKINIADTWRTVTKIQINIGDAWRTVYQA